jgi:glycerol-3-phosphate O-acyltransferase / dihydroxyacetone phosphate acyltransferase
MMIRAAWAVVLLLLSSPGLIFWFPVALTTFIGVHEFKKTGPIWDTWDEIAQYKLVYGLVSGLCVWIGAMLITLPVAFVTAILVPVVMWMSLRWFEDCVAAARAFAALSRLALVGPHMLTQLGTQRESIHVRLLELAIRLGLPSDPETVFTEGERHKGRDGGGWRDSTRYFSVRRRRKRDWNETLRLWEQFDYPEDES